MLKVLILNALLVGFVLATEPEEQKQRKRGILDNGWVGVPNPHIYGQGKPWAASESPWKPIVGIDQHHHNHGWKHNELVIYKPHIPWAHGSHHEKSIIKTVPVYITKHVVVREKVPVYVDKPYHVAVPVEKIIHKAVAIPVPVPEAVPIPVPFPVHPHFPHHHHHPHHNEFHGHGHFYPSLPFGFDHGYGFGHSHGHGHGHGYGYGHGHGVGHYGHGHDHYGHGHDHYGHGHGLDHYGSHGHGHGHYGHSHEHDHGHYGHSHEHDHDDDHKKKRSEE